jgi:hypothetical protein
MKKKPAKKTVAAKTAAKDEDTIEGYNEAQSPCEAAICRVLRAEIDGALKKGTAKIWHGTPVWFIGENPVVGYNVTAKGVALLFWNGQSFDEPELQVVGKFKAAQIKYADAAQIEVKALRRWLKKARTEIWDYRGYFEKQMALRKKGKGAKE